MKSSIKTISLLALLLVGLLTIVSCVKEPDQIGLDIQPPGEKLGVLKTDTITLIAYSIPEDSVRTDEQLALNVIGSHFDPIFGKTTASVYTEFLMTGSKLDLGTNPVIDSIFLILAIRDVYGDTITTQTFRVYELSQNIHFDSTYYSTNSVPVFESRELGNLTFFPHKDSVLVDTVKKAPHLRIRLNQNLAQKLLSGTEDDYASNAAFRTFFKGINITADQVNVPGKGAFVLFDLLSENSMLTIHYKNSEKDSLSYTFAALSNYARFNRYNHYQYADADPVFKRQVFQGDTTLGASKIYLQPFGGVKTKIKLPYLKDWAKLKKIVVNDAQLILTNADTAFAFPPPSYLAAARLVDAANKYVVLEDQYEGEDYFDGNYNSTSKTYRFKLSRYVQKQIQQSYNNNYGLILLAPNASINPQRLIIHGPNAGSGKLKMIITYSVIE